MDSEQRLRWLPPIGSGVCFAYVAYCTCYSIYGIADLRSRGQDMPSNTVWMPIALTIMCFGMFLQSVCQIRKNRFISAIATSLVVVGVGLIFVIGDMIHNVLGLVVILAVVFRIYGIYSARIMRSLGRAMRWTRGTFLGR